jgi:uncharacterized protein
MFLIQLTIFLAIFATIIFAAHYYIYISSVRFFLINEITNKNILIVLLVFLAISFFLASLLSHWKENSLTRAYYFVSGLWLGLLGNLILAATLVWLIILLARFFGFQFEPFILASFFFTLAGMVTIHGAWKAFQPEIKEITVKIPNLPDEWKGKKIIHLSDVHLGQVYRENFMRKVAKKVNSKDPEIVLITGDLFDGMDGDLDSTIKPLDTIHAKKGIFFVTGNHETYLGLEKTYATLQKTRIKILEDEVVDVNGIKIIGISYPPRMETKNITATLQKMKDAYYEKPNILLFHSPVQIDEISQAGINLQLCGHTHKGQIFPLNLITKIIYRGYDYGLHTIGDYNLYVSSGVGTWGPSMRTGNSPEIVSITLK